jgi:Lon protease-like protein
MKYLRIAGNEFLSNVDADPLERADLKERQSDVFKRMAQSYEEWNTTMLPDRNDVRSGGYADELADHFGVQRK